MPTQYGRKRQDVNSLSWIHSAILLLLLSCQTGSGDSIQVLKNGTIIVFCDSTLGGREIVEDRKTAFFETIQPADIALQMSDAQSNATVYDYKQSLQREVQNFTHRERSIVSLQMRDLVATNGIFQRMIPDTLFFIKTSGKHYGSSVFYTREKCIIIPANVLLNRNIHHLSEIWVHEIAHIYTRYHPLARRQLYAAIGFDTVDCLTPSPLHPKRLLNPDGVAAHYVLPVSGKGYLVFLDTLSQENIHNTSVMDRFTFAPTLFTFQQGCLRKDSLDADISIEQKRRWIFEKATKNTDYINHPDEIIADNFRLLYLRYTQQLSPLSERGERLLHAIEYIVKSHDPLIDLQEK